MIGDRGAFDLASWALQLSSAEPEAVFDSRPTLALSRLPTGWHGLFLTATRRMCHDVPKSRRFRQVGFSALLGRRVRVVL